MTSKKAPADRKPKRQGASAAKRARPIRPKLPACTFDQQAAMGCFLQFLLLTAEQTRQTYREVVRRQDNQTIRGTLAYWENAVSILKWAMTLNNQRKPVNGKSSDLRSE